MMTQRRSHHIRCAVCCILLFVVSATSARADFTWDLVLAIIAGQKLESWAGDRTEEQETDAIALAHEAYDEKQGTSSVGRAMIGGARLAHLPDGTVTELTFQFVTANSGLPTLVPGLFSVRYEKQVDPPVSGPISLELLGVSSDPACNYCLPFTISGFEPLIVATPLDMFGNPLLVSGAAGSDVSKGVAINIDLSPPGIPDGSIGQPLRVDKSDPLGSVLELEWDATTCPDIMDQQVIYGFGGSLPGTDGEPWVPSGAMCGVGSGSVYTWVDVPSPVDPEDSGLLWFLPLATNGIDTEGAWGLSSSGERFGPAADGSSAQCGMTKKSLAYRCGNGTCDVDIRTTVRAARDDPDDTQVNYDGINRTLHMYGQVPFEELFEMSLEELEPQFLARLDSLEDCTGLPTDPVAIATAFAEAAVEASGMTLGQIITLQPGEFPDVQAKFSELRSHGIGFPKPALTGIEADERILAIDELIAQAGSYSFRDMYFLAANDADPALVAAVEWGKATGVLKLTICAPGEVCAPVDSFAMCDNDRCCSKGTGSADTDECFARTDDFCNRPPPSRAYCTFESNACP